MEMPSQTAFNSQKNKDTTLERSAVAPMTTQRRLERVQMIDSLRLAVGGFGRMFSPNTFFLRFRSFSSPTIPVQNEKQDQSHRGQGLYTQVEINVNMKQCRWFVTCLALELLSYSQQILRDIIRHDLSIWNMERDFGDLLKNWFVKTVPSTESLRQG